MSVHLLRAGVALAKQRPCTRTRRALHTQGSVQRAARVHRSHCVALQTLNSLHCIEHTEQIALHCIANTEHFALHCKL